MDKESRGQIAAKAVPLIGGVFLLFGTCGLLQDAQFQLNGLRARATTIAHTGPEGSRDDRPIVQYFAGGRSWTMAATKGLVSFRVGDRIWVRYIPSEPGNAREEGLLQFDSMFAAIGLALLVGTALVVWDLKRA